MSADCHHGLGDSGRKISHAALVNDNERLRKCLGDREEEITRRKDDLKWNQRIEDERRLCELRERQQQHDARVVEGKTRRGIDRFTL